MANMVRHTGREFSNHRWNKLKLRLADIIVPELDISFNNSPVRKKTAYSEIILRFFQVKFNGEIIYRFPNDSEESNDNFLYGWQGAFDSEYSMENPKQSIINYLDLPKNELLQFQDKCGLADILKVCDRRIGYNRLKEIELSLAAKKIFDVRFKDKIEKTPINNDQKFQL
jgi:hypothetical protein